MRPTRRVLFINDYFTSGLNHQFIRGHFHTAIGPFNIVCGPTDVLRAMRGYTRIRPHITIFALNAGRICVLGRANRVISGYRGHPRHLFRRERLDMRRYTTCLRGTVSLLGRQNLGSRASRSRTFSANLGMVVAMDPVHCTGCNCRKDRLSGTALRLTTSHLIGTGPNILDCFPTCRVVGSRLHSCQFCGRSVLRPDSRTMRCV